MVHRCVFCSPNGIRCIMGSLESLGIYHRMKGGDQLLWVGSNRSLLNPTEGRQVVGWGKVSSLASLTVELSEGGMMMNKSTGKDKLIMATGFYAAIRDSEDGPWLDTNIISCPDAITQHDAELTALMPNYMKTIPILRIVSVEIREAGPAPEKDQWADVYLEQWTQ